MGGMSGGKVSIKNHTIYQQDFYSNNDDMSSVNCFINSHTLSQSCNSITVKYMSGDAEKGDLSSVYGSMISHTLYQPNDLKSLINYNDRDDMEMNDNLHNGYVSSVIGLINSYTIPQCN